MDRHSVIAGPHLATSVAYYIIGVALIYWALRIWWMHPLNRAFFFGRFVTEAGLALVLRNWTFTFLFGAFILSCGIEHHLDYLASKGRVDPLLVRFTGIVEAIIALWTAASVLYVSGALMWRTYRQGRSR